MSNGGHLPHNLKFYSVFGAGLCRVLKLSEFDLDLNGVHTSALTLNTYVNSDLGV